MRVKLAAEIENHALLEVVVENEAAPTSTTTQNSIRNQPINLPWVLVGRENKLVKKIITNSKNYYHDADAFLFASSCENMPNILLEAMISGLPIISSCSA